MHFTGSYSIPSSEPPPSKLTYDILIINKGEIIDEAVFFIPIIERTLWPLSIKNNEDIFILNFFPINLIYPLLLRS